MQEEDCMDCELILHSTYIAFMRSCMSSIVSSSLYVMPVTIAMS